MSGYNDFQTWIDKDAKHVFLLNGKKRKIKRTFFTSSPVPNDDKFVLKLKGGGKMEEIDWTELRTRFQEHQTAQASS